MRIFGDCGCEHGGNPGVDGVTALVKYPHAGFCGIVCAGGDRPSRASGRVPRGSFDFLSLCRTGKRETKEKCDAFEFHSS